MACRRTGTGPSVRIFQLLARQFRFTPEIDLNYEGRKFDRKKGKYVKGPFRKVQEEKC